MIKIDLLNNVLNTIMVYPKFITYDGDFENIEWLDTRGKPTLEDYKFALDEYNNKILLTQYQRDRKSEYDKLNQDELRYNDLINGTNIWIEAINEIKLKYPKPE